MNTFGFEKSRENGGNFVLKENESGFTIQSNRNNFQLCENNEEQLTVLRSSLEGYCYTTVSAVMFKIKKMFEDYYDGLEISLFLYDEKTSKAIENVVNKNKSRYSNKNNHEVKIQHNEKNTNKGKSKNKEKHKSENNHKNKSKWKTPTQLL